MGWVSGQQATIENVCVGARDAAIGQLMSSLDAIMVEWEIMSFDQAAQIFDYDQDGNADELGNPQTSREPSPMVALRWYSARALRRVVGTSSVNSVSLV